MASVTGKAQKGKGKSPPAKARNKTNAQLLQDRIRAWAKGFQADVRAIAKGSLAPEVAREKQIERAGEAGFMSTLASALIGLEEPRAVAVEPRSVVLEQIMEGWLKEVATDAAALDADRLDALREFTQSLRFTMFPPDAPPPPCDGIKRLVDALSEATMNRQPYGGLDGIGYNLWCDLLAGVVNKIGRGVVSGKMDFSSLLSMKQSREQASAGAVQ